MAASLYDLSVPTFLQTVSAVAGFLDRAAMHCAKTGADPDDFVDIFADPDTSRLSRFLQGRSPDEIDRIMATLETAFPKKRSG